jgi:hypothetical protein
VGVDFRAELVPLLKLPSAGGEPDADRAVVPGSSSGVHRPPSTRILKILSVARGFVVRENDSYAEDSPSKGIGLEATKRPGLTPDPNWVAGARNVAALCTLQWGRLTGVALSLALTLNASAKQSNR